MHRNLKPLVQGGILMGEDHARAQHPITIGSEGWKAWLGDHDGFIFEGDAGHFTARCELRRGIRYWYGYRRRRGKLTKIYLGKAEELSLERLERSGGILAGSSTVPTPEIIPGAPVASVPHPATLPVLNETGAGAPIPALTRIKPPPFPPGLIARPRLVRKFNTPVTFICAPGGYGKSTLLNEWRQACGMLVAWVSLEPGDNNPSRFWSKVVTALQEVAPGLGQGWFTQLFESSPAAFARIVVNLTNDIVRMTDDPDESKWIGLILDNYHHIKNPEIHTSLQTWLEHMPAKQKLIISSHTQPPLALGYLKAQGMVTELDANDLSFTLEEGIEFLRQHTPENFLAIGDMQKLVKRTEGWITGLVLATSALTKQGEGSRLMETFTGSHPLLREYFAENVLKELPPDLQNALIKTSILKHLTGSLCDAVSGSSDSSEILGGFWDKKLFIEKVDESDWYRYHRLFGEMLHSLLKEKFPAEIPFLHRRAAEWYRARNDPTEAIFHLLDCEEWEEAALLIESVALNELGQLGEDSRLLRWLRRLPEEVVQQHKILLEVYIRLAGLALPPKAVDDFLSRSEKRIAAMPTSEKTSDVLRTLADIKRLRRLWIKEEKIKPGARARKGKDTVGQMLDGILQYHRERRDDLIKAELMASEVYEAARARGHLFSVLMAGGACADLAFSQGHLNRSEQIAHKVLKQASEFREKLPEPASIALISLANVYYERNQQALAYQHLERAIEVDPDPISKDVSISMAILRAKIQSIKGDLENAVATIQSVRDLNSQQPSNLWHDQDLVAYQALFHIHQGDPITAERYLGGGWEIDTNPFSAFVRASLLVYQNRNFAAEEILSHLLERYPHSFYWVPILRVRAMLAIVLFNQQKMNQARQVMAEAARIAAPESFVRPFIFIDPKIAPLITLVLHTENLNSGTRSFLKGVLTYLGHADHTLERMTRDERLPLTIAASISPREQEILQSLSLGLSNRDIAALYSISDSTVKTHVENIFRKLEVNNRTQAIAQAQALGLIHMAARD